MPKITFLTRKGCPNSPVMYQRLMSELAERRIAQEPETVDIGHLEKGDLRTGYGTPTVLIDDVDLFGLETPAPTSPM